MSCQTHRQHRLTDNFCSSFFRYFTPTTLVHITVFPDMLGPYVWRSLRGRGLALCRLCFAGLDIVSSSWFTFPTSRQTCVRISVKQVWPWLRTSVCGPGLFSLCLMLSLCLHASRQRFGNIFSHKHLQKTTSNYKLQVTLHEGVWYNNGFHKAL